MSRARNNRKKQLRRARDFPFLFEGGDAPASWNGALRAIQFAETHIAQES